MAIMILHLLGYEDLYIIYIRIAIYGVSSNESSVATQDLHYDIIFWSCRKNTSPETHWKTSYYSLDANGYHCKVCCKCM